MRLWHYKLIQVLPKKQLVSQWRECIAIKGMWEKGKLANQPLVNYMMNYDKRYFGVYVATIITEMTIRHIKHQKKYYQEFNEFCGDNIYNFDKTLYYIEHNDRYLKQCYYNLQEKHDRGMISDIEWKSIELLMEKEVI